ncbi:Sulfiredoxin [Apophysomyces sp. BC1034]|nr:Sulfiredoxin [Apophysomyces sp. BC1015]KAG0181145.1 Sulfiredoxin [Apophysomyces sp. BC1021]KAG0191604.1 Sulfiredoxin [Apophysomyces sp. BC1034]
MAVDNFSIHGNAIEEVHDIPLSAVNRPIPSILDRAKVEEMKNLLQDPEHQEELTPIDVHHVQYKGDDYYFAFGGCHRWAAHKELKKETIRGKLIKTPPSVIKTYLGASSPFKDV